MARHLLVTNDYLPKTGGIQVYLHELWRRLEDGRAVVLSASSHEDAKSFDAASDVVIERVANATLFLPTWKAYRAIEDAIERHQPDLVLFDPAWPLGVLGPRLSRPYGVILHGAEVTIPARLPFVASSLRYVLKRADVAICAGTYSEGEARRNAAENLCPTIQIPPGVDVAHFVPLSDAQRGDVRREMGFGDEEFLVASYSRLVPRKGMDTLIRASALLATKYPQFRVAIGGAGRDDARLQRLAVKSNAPVTFLGRVDDDLLARWIASSDLMVMDCRSRWLGLEQEGFGIVFVEAAACGVAQVAGLSGGSHEAVRDGVTGDVVRNTRSARALANAIESLMLDGERRRSFAQRSREMVLSEFSWDLLAEKLSSELAPFDHFNVQTSLL
ncbi:MAG TPA: glycosyltransferase family 4 protein [Acidimicrobiales bacterium]|nr:glycosyltransferase family 4 protein [Acidimicrobiales bacterium]